MRPFRLLIYIQIVNQMNATVCINIAFTKYNEWKLKGYRNKEVKLLTSTNILFSLFIAESETVQSIIGM